MAVKIDGINVHSDYRNASLVKRLGCQWVRVDINWWTIETSPGSYNWSLTDKIINHYHSNGLLIYATLMGTPACYGANINVPPGLEEWANFCSAFAKRYYGKVHVVSIWNEPNLGKTFWNGSKKQFFKTMMHGYQAIKKVNPNILVASPDISTASGSDWVSWAKLCEQYNHYIDILSVHTYQKTAEKVVRCWNHGKYWFLGWLIPKYRPYKWYFNAVKKPIYLTEIGLPASYESDKEQTEQKNFVKKIMEKKKKLKNVMFIFFYCLVDADRSLEKPFGFYTSLGLPKKVSV